MLGRGVPAESVDGQRLHSFFCRALLHPCDGSMVFGGRLGGRVLDIYIYILNFYWLCWVFVAAHGFSLVLASGGYSLVVACRLLTVVASLVAKHRLWSVGSVVAPPGLSCSAACGLIPDQGWNQCPLHCKADS